MVLDQIRMAHMPMMNDDGELEYLKDMNLDTSNLSVGEWIAIADRRIVAHSMNLKECMELARAAGYPEPLVTAVSSGLPFYG